MGIDKLPLVLMQLIVLVVNCDKNIQKRNKKIKKINQIAAFILFCLFLIVISNILGKLKKMSIYIHK